jgi:predicted Zn finger-like uncharacterized protein
MLITCPTCASSYRIKAAKIGPEGRSVRCAACRETWFLTPADAVPDEDEVGENPMAALASDPVADAAWMEAAMAVREATAEVEAPAAKGPTRRAAGRRKEKGRFALPWIRSGARKSWPVSPVALVGLALLATLPVLCLARSGVVSVMPRTAALFGAVGMPVNRRGLEIRDVVAFQSPAGEDRPGELVVEGDIVGVGRAARSVPMLNVTVSDAAGKPLKTFSTPAPRQALDGGESVRFRARLADPPNQGRVVDLRFADGSAAEGGRTRND